MLPAAESVMLSVKGATVRKALIIVDMLDDFVDGTLANPRAQAIVAAATTARARGQHTHICVHHSSYGALIRGYEIIVPRDAVCAFEGVDGGTPSSICAAFTARRSRGSQS
jgi:nicotinamidase-related amidase